MRSPGSILTVKNPWESSRGPQSSRISIVASGVYGGHGAIFSEENFIFRRKIASLQILRPEPEGFQQNLSKGW